MFEILLGGGKKSCIELPANLGPGAEILKALTCEDNAGFFGETSSSDLVTGDALATAMNLSVGVGINSNSNWLKFVIDGKILYIAKKPLRHSISHFDLNSINLIHGDRTIELKNDLFKVRLISGFSKPDPIMGASDVLFNPPVTHGSEWNRLMYRITAGTNNDNFLGTVDSPASWSTYSLNDLGVGPGATDGRCSIVKEVTTAGRYCRRMALGGISHTTNVTYTVGDPVSGWRPVLELIQ